MLEIKVVENPDRNDTQIVLYFQFRFMGWTKDDMETQWDQYGSLPYGYVLAYKDNELVGVINLMSREISLNGLKIQLGGLGGVCVHEKYRRQGIAHAMIQTAMENLKHHQLDVAYLCTDIDRLGNLYGPVGFVPLNRPYVATGTSGNKYACNGAMVAPVTSNEIFNLVLAGTEDFDLNGQDW